MLSSVLKADLILLGVSIIWGASFVAQRLGMETLGPHAYNGMRFAMGALLLLPAALWTLYKRQPIYLPQGDSDARKRTIWFGCLVAGLLLAAGSAMQQVGMVHTSAGKGGFLTALYIILVPLMGAFIGRIPSVAQFVWASLALTGVYFLSVTDAFTLAPGDGWVMASAVIWAVHLLLLSWLSRQINAVLLATVQSGICGTICLSYSLATETTTWAGIVGAAWPLLYGGPMTVALGFTLQIVGQRSAPPVHAALILGLESLFAAIAGWLILNEHLTSRALFGCALVLTAVCASTLTQAKRELHINPQVLPPEKS